MQQKILDFIVDDQFIRAPHYTVVADSKDYLLARFTFSEQWQGLVKTAVFQGADGKAYFVVLDKDTCPIPWEVIQPTRFLVSVFGGDRLTADRAMVEVAASGFTTSGITPPAPTPDVYNQLTEAVSTERQLAEAAATAAAEKAEQCVQFTSAAESLLQDAESVPALVAAAKEAEQRAQASAATAAEQADAAKTAVASTEENAKAANASAATAEQHVKDARTAVSNANTHASAAFIFSEEARAATNEATAVAQQMQSDLEQIQKIAQGMSRQLLATVTVGEPTAVINVAFERPVKDFYLVFKGQLAVENTVKDCILSCMTDKGYHFFFYAPHLTVNPAENFVYVAHAQQMAGNYWMTKFATNTLAASMRGTETSGSTTKTSFSKRNSTSSPYVNSIQFFEFNEKYLFTTDSTVEIWGIYAE